MKRTVFTLALALGVGIAIGVIGDQALNAQQAATKRTVLLKADLEGIAGKEATVSFVEIAPGGATGKHYHPGSEFAYVIEGSGALLVEGKPPVTFKAGQAFSPPYKQVHNFENASKTAPVKLVGILIAEKGQPPAVSVK